MTQDPKTSEKLLQATRQALNTASFRANQYKQVVQKKIDLGAIQRKIEQLHTDLGKQLDDLYQEGKQDLIEQKPVAALLEKLTGLRQAAAMLEEEIELIRNETPEKTDNPESPASDSDAPGQPQ